MNSSNDKNFSEFKELFTRVGKNPIDHKVTHFHSPLKPVKAKGRRVPLRLLAGLNEKLKRMETEGHIVKLQKVTKIVLSARLILPGRKTARLNWH